MKEWLFLIGAIVLETFATTMLKYSEQFTKLLPTIGMLAGYLLSFYCLSHALRTLPIGIAYAIWSALSTGGQTPCEHKQGGLGWVSFLTLHRKILIYRLLFAVVNILKWCEMLLEHVGMLKKNGRIFGG